MSLFDYLFESSFITIIVLLLLSIYFIATIWVFTYRYSILRHYIIIEKKSLDYLYMDRNKSVTKESLLFKYLNSLTISNKAILNAAINDTVRSSTKGLTLLSTIASTSPFIGLFGTVIGILETFSKLGAKSSTALSVIAPAISEALIATAVGIFVAIFAYTFHLIIKRKAYELSSILQSQAEVIIANEEHLTR
ncbi:MotA/TolQ/ExbB proton channel family protein [hydrothermal vent metagenome]|uniref:MotA/TolQ/ExbB proton channel family protein n=1 Tax=hydrothermal vent metagenome TaxID=652676 RepID=A0A1W1EJD9_9ZZZZ